MRHLRRAELGKRRSAASQNRMRIISSLGAEPRVKKGKRNKEDTFGMDDEDWNVYRAIVSTCIQFPAGSNRTGSIGGNSWMWHGSRASCDSVFVAICSLCIAIRLLNVSISV